MELFEKIINELKPFTIFATNLHRRCSTGFFEALQSGVKKLYPTDANSEFSQTSKIELFA